MPRLLAALRYLTRNVANPLQHRPSPAEATSGMCRTRQVDSSKGRIWWLRRRDVREVSTFDRVVRHVRTVRLCVVYKALINAEILRARQSGSETERNEGVWNDLFPAGLKL